MLHCLYNIYRYAHPDFFGEDPNGPEWIATHTDHCIDNLRQVGHYPSKLLLSFGAYADIFINTVCAMPWWERL